MSIREPLSYITVIRLFILSGLDANCYFHAPNRT